MRWQTWVSHASPSPRMGQLAPEVARAGGGCWWGHKHDPLFLVDEDFGDGLLPWQEGLGGEEVRLETSGRATISPGVLWLLQPPRCSSAIWACAVVAAGFWVAFTQVWVPLCQANEMKTSGNPAGTVGTVSSGGTSPSHPTSTSPRR